MTETDLELGDGRTLHAFDTGTDDGYGGSTPCPDRDVASSAANASSVADALGIDRFAIMGHSGGGSHALACGALLPERVLGVVIVAGLAPFGAEGLGWFEGFGPSGVAKLRAAAAGRAALAKHLAESDDEPDFTPEDEAALAGEWSWFIDDDLAGVGAWGFDPADIVNPALFLHGGRDRVVPAAHGEWLAHRCPSAELWLRPDDGHISIKPVLYHTTVSEATATMRSTLPYQA